MAAVDDHESLVSDVTDNDVANVRLDVEDDVVNEHDAPYDAREDIIKLENNDNEPVCETNVDATSVDREDGSDTFDESRAPNLTPEDISKFEYDAKEQPRCENEPNVIHKSISTDAVGDEQPPNKTETRLALIGRTGSGKSASGNTLLGDEIFKSSSSASSGTSSCQLGTKITQNGAKYLMVDTPGLFDTSEARGEVVKEISRCVTLTSPGPHLFLYVVGIGRFTNEDTNGVQMFFKHFGEDAAKYTIVLFTRADMLDEDQSVSEYLETAPQSLVEFLKQCDYRYFALNNKSCRREQIIEFESYIQRVISENDGRYYSNIMYVEHTRLLKEKEEEIRRKNDEALKKEETEMKRKMEEKLQEEMEAEKQNQREMQEKILKEQERIRRQEERERKERERIAAEIRRQEAENRRRRRELEEEYETEKQERKERERLERRRHQEYLDTLRRERQEQQEIRRRAQQRMHEPRHDETKEKRYCIIM